MQQTDESKSKLKFARVIWNYYKRYKRVLPWRKTQEPYKIVVSEIMLQQTQADRVVPKYNAFLKKFPSWRSLSKATLLEVLREWQGLGYNRRAKMLHRLAQEVVGEHKGKLPRDYDDLIKLPGIGPATANAIRAFAFNLPGVYLETNVRSVYLHYFFKDKQGVHDTELLPLIQQTMGTKNPREWNWALLDYGVMLKKLHSNPSRASKHYIKQSKFVGSDRQLRGKIISALLEQKSTRVQLVKKLGESLERVSVQLQKLMKEEMVEKKGIYYSL